MSEAGVKEMVPAIRFEGFRGNWEERPLHLLANVIDGDRGHNYPSGNDLQQSGHTLFLSATNVTKNGFKFDKKEYITREKSNSMGNGKIVLNDIILTSRGSIGHVALYSKMIEQTFPFLRINSGMLILRSIASIEPCALAQFLNSPLGKKKIDLISFGSAQPQLTKQSVSNCTASLPKIKEEQTKIGTYFQQLDALIAGHRGKREKLLQLKKSLLEKMFPKQGQDKPEIRFTGFDEDWEAKCLEDVVLVNSGRDYKHLKDGDVPVYGTGGYMLSVNEALSENFDAIGIGRKGTIDRPYLLGAPFWTVDTLFYCVTKARHELNFVYSIFQKIRWKLMDESTGVPSLSKVAISGVSVKMPKAEEQTKIGQLFKHTDTLINQHQSQITKLLNIKQACLAKMFV